MRQRQRDFCDYYRILEVHPSASAQEIRRAFRKLVLQAHPDKNPDRREWSERRIRVLIQAYEIIGNSQKRQRFDLEYRARQRSAPVAFREDQLFFFRKSDPEAYAHRVLYYLLNGRGREAVPVLAKMEARHGSTFLKDELDRGDYLDCLFLLGEYHLENRQYREALLRMRAFYLHERNARYPRHYLDAVVNHLKDLYLRKIPQHLPPSEALYLLHEAEDLALRPRDLEILERVSEKLRRKIADASGRKVTRSHRGSHGNGPRRNGSRNPGRNGSRNGSAAGK